MQVVIRALRGFCETYYDYEYVVTNSKNIELQHFDLLLQLPFIWIYSI